MWIMGLIIYTGLGTVGQLKFVLQRIVAAFFTIAEKDQVHLSSVFIWIKNKTWMCHTFSYSILKLSLR